MVDRRRLMLGSLGLAAGTAASAIEALAQRPTAQQVIEPSPGERQAIGQAVDAFIRNWAAPGLSMAIAHHGRLAFQAAYGLADARSGERLTPAHRFRIASVSKPITSVAIMMLAERGALRLTDYVFGPGRVLDRHFPMPRGARWLDEITIEHLLTHTSGGWPNDGNDPMFTAPSVAQPSLIQSTLATRPLRSRPGTAHAYSNFGYCLLGRVIEAASGEPYEAFVRRFVLGPAGAAGMSIGGNTLAERAPAEVHYASAEVPGPYGINVRRMDSHGGWIATAGDLVAFALSVDGLTPGSLLQPSSIAQMTAPSSANPGYAKGWAINAAGNWWHNGALPGTTSIIVRTRSYLSWAALVNGRPRGNRLLGALDGFMWEVVRKVPRWNA